nr:hypothetical protein [Tanacetum cinerariifolium]
MNPIATQQATLDNALVPSEKRLKIERSFQINAKVSEIYMHQFWNTIKKIGKTDGYNFKLDKKKYRVDTENVDYVDVLWEDFMYQADNREISLARKEHMPYPRFTKVIIDHFISKDNAISMRNDINLHIVRDDTLLGTLKFVSKTKDCQIYGVVIPDGMINDDIKLSKAYKTYLDYRTGKFPPKKDMKFKKPAFPKLKNVLSFPKEPTQKDTHGKSVSKTKATAKTDRGKGIKLLFDAALLKDAQLKETLRKSKQETHKLQANGSSEGVDFESEVPDEHADKTKDMSKGTDVIPGVLDVSKEDSFDSDDDSWDDSENKSDDVNDEDDDNDDNGDDDNSDDNDDGGNEDDYEENPLFTLADYTKEEQDKEYVYTQEKEKSNDEEKMFEEKEDDVVKELYEDLNIT